jgi:hypothetical protein
VSGTTYESTGGIDIKVKVVVVQGTRECENQVAVVRYFIKKAFTCGKHISYHRCCPPWVAWRIGQFCQQLLLPNDVCLEPSQEVTWLERDQFAYASAYQNALQHPSLLHQNQSHDGILRLWQNRSDRQNLINNSKNYSNSTAWYMKCFYFFLVICLVLFPGEASCTADKTTCLSEPFSEADWCTPSDRRLGMCRSR